MYRHIHEYDLRYIDVDAYDIIKPSALLGLMQESAGFSADELGFGFDVVSKLGMAFILSGWYVELYRPVRQGEKLAIHTWPVKPHNVILIRDYELYVGNEKVGAATSRWCLMNIKSFSLLPLNKFFNDDYYSKWNTERSIDFNNWKMPKVGNGEVAYSLDIGYSDYDHNFHVNNTKYADFLLDAFSFEDFKGKYISKIQISYVKQCKIGEKLDLIKVCEGENYLLEGRVGGELRVAMKVELNEV